MEDTMSNIVDPFENMGLINLASNELTALYMGDTEEETGEDVEEEEGVVDIKYQAETLETKIKQLKKRKRIKDEDDDLPDEVFEMLNCYMEVLKAAVSAVLEQDGPVESSKNAKGTVKKVPKKFKKALDEEQPWDEIFIRKKSGMTDIDHEGIIDLTFSGKSPWNKFSFLFPHGNIPIPFTNKKKFGMSVEGIWQSLKVFEKDGIDLTRLSIINGKGVRRNPTKYSGTLQGFQAGVLEGSKILPIHKARYKILFPTYKFILDNYLQNEIHQLHNMLLNGKRLILLDTSTSTDPDGLDFSCAWLVKKYLKGEYPTETETS